MIKFNEIMYNLDSPREVKLEQLVILDSYSGVTLAKPLNKYTIEDCIVMMDSILTSLESSTTVGFLPSIDLTKFPIVVDLLQPFLRGNETEVTEYVRGGKAMETYK
jgi:hypothetical protein